LSIDNSSNDTSPGDISSKDVPKKWFENDDKISLPTVFLSDIELTRHFIE
jgi:hypothetical protein